MSVAASPDWLFHHMVVSGPATRVTAFRLRARGAPAPPWHLDLDAEEARLLRPMIAEGGPARILARQIREAVAAHHELVQAQAGGTAMPLDLHRLVPVPDAILRLGADHPSSERWLWEHWGTPRPLRRVELHARADRRLRRTAQVEYRFFSADWTPWQAIRTLRHEWHDLVFDIRPQYGQ